MADFLFEIGLEEVPARMLAGAQAELLKRTVALLERERLIPAGAKAEAFSTPRRLAVLIHNVAERQEDLSEELLGPAAKIAYKDGQPGPAALAFAKKSGVAVDALRLVDTPKGEYLAATSTKPGRSAADLLAAELPKELAALYWAKNMAWRAGKPERFVRPVRWMIGLLDNEIVPISFGGYTAAQKTYGHRVLFGPTPIRIDSPTTYPEQLTAASVMVDVELRRHTIRKALDRVCRSIPAVAGQATRWREDHALVDKMTHMTEWPSVIAGAFEPEYLALPEEVLVTVMRDHQNYFAVESNDGKLAPHFLAVLNTVADEAGEAIIRHGNERVLRARFNDARFFWEFDQRTALEDRVTLLEHVTFQKDLGSYAKKSLRVATIAASLGKLVRDRGLALDEAALATASRLAKTDLTTELVKEFTELQGEVGGLYARAQGISSAAADAIYDQYRPTSMEDRIPRTLEGQVLAIADKIDTIAGMFGLGMEPTGSKDPFALRRAANGIVKILSEGSLPLTLSDVLEATDTPAMFDAMSRFFAERIEFYLREVKGQAYDIVLATRTSGLDDIRDAVKRAEALAVVRPSEDFLALSAAFKRIRKILDQAVEKGISPRHHWNADLLAPGPERELAKKTVMLRQQIAALGDPPDYVASLRLIATMRPEVDAFFNSVMVMDPDEALRDNRLALLQRTLLDFTVIGDFSEIVTAGS